MSKHYSKVAILFVILMSSHQAFAGAKSSFACVDSASAISAKTDYVGSHVVMQIYSRPIHGKPSVFGFGPRPVVVPESLAYDGSGKLIGNSPDFITLENDKGTRTQIRLRSFGHVDLSPDSEVDQDKSVPKEHETIFNGEQNRGLSIMKLCRSG